MTPRRFGPELLLVLATLIWGGTFVATRAGLGFVSPLLIIAIRFLTSFTLLAVVLSTMGRRWWEHWRGGIVVGVVLAGGYTLQTVGLQFTTASRSAFLTYLFAVLVPPLQVLIGRKRLRAVNLVGLLVVLAGTAVMTSPWAASGWNRGDLVTIAGAVCFALFVVLIDRYGATGAAIDLVPTQFLIAGGIALVLALVLEEVQFVAHPAAWSALAYLTLLGTIGALGLQTVFQHRTTPVRATTIYALEPVFATIFALAVLGERVGVHEIAGGAIILGGVLLSELWALGRGRRA